MAHTLRVLFIPNLIICVVTVDKLPNTVYTSFKSSFGIAVLYSPSPSQILSILYIINDCPHQYRL